MHKRIFKRNDGKNLFLFSNKIHDENNSKELDITEESHPHLRWNPARQEWVTYSSKRNNRTSFPPEEYCPLCPSGKINYPTEIPFNDFEIAIFPNRWPSFNTHSETLNNENIKIKNSNGFCEVVVYSSEHLDSLAEMPIERVELLTKALIDRYKNLLPRKDIAYVMPFENRGQECGVTLHHPHGQIYCYPFIPPVIEKEILSFQKENFILKMMQSLEEKYFVYQDKYMIAAVPPFARYAYEIWIMPKKKIAGPWYFNEDEINSFSKCLQKVIRGYDSFLQKKCPYIMGMHAAPQLDDDTFHFHVEFYPPLRSGNKPKVLAGSESMAGVFIMDVLPEESASILRNHINK